MYIGHFGLGLAAKKADSRPSLGTLFLASQFIDLLWPFLVLFGIEWLAIEPGNTAVVPLNFEHYPVSYSLFWVLIWSVLFSAVYFFIRKEWKTSLIMGGLVLSHWVLDFFTHRPDLQLAPWSEFRVGLGLWNSLPGTLILEGMIFAGGAWLYLSVTKAQNKKGSVGLWALLIFLVITYLMNVFGPPPPSLEAIPYVGFSQWLLIIWAYWIDRNRTLKVSGSSNL